MENYRSSLIDDGNPDLGLPIPSAKATSTKATVGHFSTTKPWEVILILALGPCGWSSESWNISLNIQIMYKSCTSHVQVQLSPLTRQEF